MKPYYETRNGILYQGHVLDILKGMESESVQYDKAGVILCFETKYLRLANGREDRQGSVD